MNSLQELVPTVVMVFAIAFAAVCVVPKANAAPAEVSEIVTSVTINDARKALSDAGVETLTDRTVDDQLPSVGGFQSDGFTVQATLYSCSTGRAGCKGVQLVAIIPATTRRNAEIIEGSIERSAFGVDASVLDVGRGNSSGEKEAGTAVLISSYLVYDHGVSAALLPAMLHLMLNIVAQTKDFMLSDDPAHAELWRRTER